MTEDNVNVPREPTPKMLAATFDHEIDKHGGIESQNTRNARIYRAMLAAAPKVEQGPVAGAKLAKAMWGVDLVPSHPAPASCELLEAAEAVLKTADREGSRMHFTSAGDVWVEHMEVGKLELEQLHATIAQHKGPQS